VYVCIYTQINTDRYKDTYTQFIYNLWRKTVVTRKYLFESIQTMMNLCNLVQLQRSRLVLIKYPISPSAELSAMFTFYTGFISLASKYYLKWAKNVSLKSFIYLKATAVPLHAKEVFGGRVGIASTHSRPRH
jgi:hypothetical protein